MGSSAKRKKEKKKDFEKPKLKVGKTKPKAANATNTSFRAKSIVLNHQSLSAAAPTASTQFVHSLSLLTSKSDSQRRDALSSIHNNLASHQAQKEQANSRGAETTDDAPAPVPDLPRPASEIISKLRPLLLDTSRAIRNLTVECLQCLDAGDVAANVELLTIYIHIGLTHLSGDIRSSAISTLEWLLNAAGEALVSSRAGWIGTVERVVALLGWRGTTTQENGVGGSNKATVNSDLTLVTSETQQGWTHTTRAKLEDPKSRARHITVLARLLEVGMQRPAQADVEARVRQQMAACFPLLDFHAHRIGTTSAPFARLNLFADADGSGKRLDEDIAISDAAARAEAFQAMFLEGVTKGMHEARREGGEIGRAAKAVERALA